MSKLFCVSIHPRAGIGYNYAVVADTPMQALAQLSWGLRLQKKLTDAAGRTTSDMMFNHTIEVIKILRKPWRRTGNNPRWVLDKVSVGDTIMGVMGIAYPETMLIDRRENGTNVSVSIIQGQNLKNNIDWSKRHNSI